ncbi:MAG: MFS transporter [Gammaproteobacteria bacterium]|nr:MFS transporter [Gammaproteobacteria bacterium]
MSGEHGVRKKTEINSARAWLVCLVMSLFFFYEFVQMNIFDSIAQDVLVDFSLSSTTVGYLASMYFYGNFLMVIPAGMLLDRFSTKKIALVAMIVSTIATIVFSQTHALLLAQICRFMAGMGAGFCFLSNIRLASRWFSANHLAFVTGVIVTMAMIGGMVAQTPMAVLAEHVGWRYAMLTNGLLGVLIIVLIGLIVRDQPAREEAHVETEHQHLKKYGVLHSLSFVIRGKNNWLGGFYTTLMNLPIFILGALWGMTYLEQVRGISHAEASYVISMLFVGVIFGSPAFGWFSDKILSRRKPMLMGAIMSLIVVLMMLYIPHLSVGSLLLLSFLLGFLTSSQIISYPAIAELNPIELTASAVSIISLVIMASGVIVQPLTGWLIGLHWDHQMVNGKPFYLKEDFMLAMLIMPISFIISFFVALCMKETGCKSNYPQLKDSV